MKIEKKATSRANGRRGYHDANCTITFEGSETVHDERTQCFREGAEAAMLADLAWHDQPSPAPVWLKVTYKSNEVVVINYGHDSSD